MYLLINHNFAVEKPQKMPKNIVMFMCGTENECEVNMKSQIVGVRHKKVMT
jgi:hypothetical protein